MNKLKKTQKNYSLAKVWLYRSEAGEGCTNTSACVAAGDNCSNKQTCR